MPASSCIQALRRLAGIQNAHQYGKDVDLCEWYWMLVTTTGLGKSNYRSNGIVTTFQAHPVINRQLLQKDEISREEQLELPVLYICSTYIFLRMIQDILLSVYSALWIIPTSMAYFDVWKVRQLHCLT